MADDLTLRLGAEVDEAVAKLERVRVKAAELGATAATSSGGVDTLGTSTSVATDKTKQFWEKLDGATNQTAAFGDTAESAGGGAQAAGLGLGTMAAGFAALAIIKYVVTTLMEWTAALEENAIGLSAQHEQTAVAVDMLQRWQQVADGTGIKAEALTSGSQQLSDVLEKIGSGSGKKAEAALNQLGLSSESLRQKSPGEAMDALMRTLGGVADITDRNRLASDILGDSYATKLAPAMRNYGELADHARVLSEASVEAIKREAQEHGVFARAIDAVKFAWNDLWATSAKTDQIIKIIKKATEDGNTALLAQYKELKAKGADLDETFTALTKTKTADVKVTQAAIPAGELYLATQRASITVAAALTTTQKAQLAAAEKIHASTEEQTNLLKETAKATLAHMVATGQLSAEQAKQIDVAKLSAAAIRVVDEQQRQVDVAAKKAATERTADEKRASAEQIAAANKHADAIHEIESAYVRLDESKKDDVMRNVALNVSESAIMETLGLTATQIRRVVEERKAQADLEKKVLDLLGAISAKQEEARKKEAAALAQAAIDQTTTMSALNDRLHELGQTGLQRRLAEIKSAEDRELASIQKLQEKYPAFYRERQAAIEAYYQHERDVANDSYDTLDERLAASGVFTKSELRTQAANAKTLYDQMVASGKYTWAELAAAKQRWKDAEKKANGDVLTDFLGLLGAISQGFANLSQVGDGSFSKITGGIAITLSAGSTLATSVKGMKTAFSALGSEGGMNLTNLASAATGVAGAIGAVVQIATTLYKVFANSEGRDAVVKYFDTFNGGADELHAKLLAIGREDLWIKLTQNTAKGNVEQAKKNIQEVTDVLEAATQAAEATAAAFANAQEKIGATLGGVTKQLGDQGRERIAATTALREQQAAYQELLASGSATDAQLLEAARNVKDATERVARATVSSQEEFDRLSRISLNTFNTLVASGVAPVDAVARIHGSVADLRAGLEAAGLQGNAAFDTLARWADLTEKQKPVLDGVGALNELMQMTTTLGGMNADVFNDMQAQGLEAYNQLVAAGYTEAEARVAIKPLLLQEIQLNKDKGYAIDEATQKIIAQGIANGDLQVANESMTDVFKEGISALILAIGGKLPEAWQKAAIAAQTAAADIADHSLSRVAGGVANIRDQLDRVDWESWADDASGAVKGVEKDVNAISFGRSPGGLKEIAPMLGKSSTALTAWARHMHQQLGGAEQRIKDFSWFGVPPGLTARLSASAEAAANAGRRADPVPSERDGALAAAVNRLASTLPGGDIVLQIDNQIDPDKFDRRVIRVSRSAHGRGEIPVRADSVRGRVANG